MAVTTEIAPNIYRISIFAQRSNLQFNHFLVKDDEPLLFHTGLRGMHVEIREAVSKLINLSELRHISFSHFESDECGCFNARHGAELSKWLLPQAVENDRLGHLAELVLEECRQRRVIIPPPRTLERLCVTVRYRARRELERRLIDGLSAEQRQRLDALTKRRSETSQSWLAWLRQMPEATKPAAMLGLIERLTHVRAIGLDLARAHRVHQARLAQLARETGRTTAQHIAGYEPQRRHAALT